MSKTITTRIDAKPGELPVIGPMLRVGAAATWEAMFAQKGKTTIRLPPMTIQYFADGNGYAIATHRGVTVRKAKPTKGKGKK